LWQSEKKHSSAVSEDEVKKFKNKEKEKKRRKERVSFLVEN
jgi:hypothetical protein